WSEPKPTGKARPRNDRMDWASLLKRVYKSDVFQCGACGRKAAHRRDPGSGGREADPAAPGVTGEGTHSGGRAPGAAGAAVRPQARGCERARGNGRADGRGPAARVDARTWATRTANTEGRAAWR